MNKLDLFDYIIKVLNLDDNNENVKLEILNYKVKGSFVDYADYLKSFNINRIHNEMFDYYFILDENINSITISTTYYFDTCFNNQLNLIYEIDINSSEILEETESYLIFKCLSPCFNNTNCDLDNLIEFTLKIYKLIEVDNY